MAGGERTLAIIAPVKAWGGIEGKLVTLCNAFVERGVQPEIVCIRGGEVPYPERLDPQVRTRQLATRSKRDGVAAVARYLRAARPDAVLTVKDHAAQVTLLARAWTRLDLPVFVKVTNTLSLVARRRLQRFMIRRLYPRAERVIANSAGVRADLLAHFGLAPEQVALIHNPTVTDDFPRRAAQPVAHPWLAADAREPVVLGVGRFTPQKDFPLLLAAFARVVREQPCRLILLGDGAGRADLARRADALGIADRVDLPGFVPDVLPWMARARLFVLSSRYEGLSNVLIEALAVGTPVVATDCPSGSAEILGDGRYGTLVPVGDAAALAVAMGQQLHSEPDAGHLAEAVARFRAGPVADTYLRTLGLAGAEESA